MSGHAKSEWMDVELICSDDMVRTFEFVNHPGVEIPEIIWNTTESSAASNPLFKIWTLPAYPLKSWFPSKIYRSLKVILANSK